ncbi:GrlR family regulatory protein [Pseudomonas antarctica]|uniref:GrlR family regulatory protein n=1 Tax=Pseudomonas antarctica TaxID=219572 RepID=UPI00345C7929
MSQGVFYVKFESNIRDFGDGLVFIKDGGVNGCDPHYLYQGAIPRESGSFETEIQVQPWRSGNTHVFGSTGAYTLKAEGTIDYEKGVFSLIGHKQDDANLRLKAAGTRLTDVV